MTGLCGWINQSVPDPESTLTDMAQRLSSFTTAQSNHWTGDGCGLAASAVRNAPQIVHDGALYAVVEIGRAHV